MQIGDLELRGIKERYDSLYPSPILYSVLNFPFSQSLPQLTRPAQFYQKN